MSLLSTLRILAVAGALVGVAHHAHAANYDAIAVDDDSDTAGGKAGYGVGEGDTQGEAQRAAVSACREKNQSCKVVVTYRQCAAYASSRQWSGIGTGSSERAARDDAVSTCGHEGCRVVVSDCVDK